MAAIANTSIISSSVTPNIDLANRFIEFPSLLFSQYIRAHGFNPSDYYVIFSANLARGFINMTFQEDLIEINPTNPPQQTIIWMHGLGADGNDFVPVVPELHLPDSMPIRFVFPHAPVMPVTLNNGYKMRAWFDIYELTRSARIDESGIASAVDIVEKLIAREEARGISAANIILAGFSQGAVVALTTGLCYPERLGGIIALSGYLPVADKVFARASKANRDIPIFIAHGTDDPIVPYTHGKGTCMALKREGYSVTWHDYPMQHSVCATEIRDISDWIQSIKNK